MDTAGALFTAAYVTDKYCPKDTCDFTDLIDFTDYFTMKKKYYLFAWEIYVALPVRRRL